MLTSDYVLMVTTELVQVADESLLVAVWKRDLRKVLRSMTFSTPNFAPDALHYAAYDWGLSTLVNGLSRDLILGRYAPERGQIVRMAKGRGLSRPLCFLATRDALVYRTITWLARSQLVSGAAAWVGVDHSEKGSAADADLEAGESFDWFRFWLDRQGHILAMVDDEGVEYFVESDVANFFPSIRLDSIREHLHSHTDLSKQVVRLALQIIDGVMPRSDYSEVSLAGLPQEQIGSSRDIGHSLLIEVDREFASEGAVGRYTRYMDDVLIGVKSEEEGEQCIARLQRSLETIGLYPNASKTRVTAVKSYLDESMVQTNADLDRISALLDANASGRPYVAHSTPDLLDQLLTLSTAHRALTDRPRRWDRLTRRIYTLHRRLGITTWWSDWPGDLRTDPGGAAAFLEYVRAWPLTLETVQHLAGLSNRYCDMYPNIGLLSAEVVCSAPVGDDPDLWSSIYAICQAEMNRLLTDSARKFERERLIAVWMLAAWKYADLVHRELMLDNLPAALDAVSPVRAQALPLLVAAGRTVSEWVAAKPGLAWEDALAAEYLRSLQTGEKRAVGVALSLVQPQLRLSPQRYTSLPRAVPFLDILRQSARSRLTEIAPKMLSKLQKNEPRLRDRRLESIVGSYCVGDASR